MRQNRVYLAWFFLHFLLIVAVSCGELLWLVARGLTIVPSPFDQYSQEAERAAAATFGRQVPVLSPVRQTLATYLHAGGIETGYGYFAPNLPASYRLVFELCYPDGRVEYELPRVNSASAGLRIAGLLDRIGRTHSDELREHLVKMMASSIWHERPEVKTMRAVLSALVLPSVADFERGQKGSFVDLYAYDFSRGAESAGSTNR